LRFELVDFVCLVIAALMVSEKPPRKPDLADTALRWLRLAVKRLVQLELRPRELLLAVKAFYWYCCALRG
jgi:hypothetical protein